MQTPTRTQESKTAELLAGLSLLRKAIRDYTDEHGECPGLNHPQWIVDQLVGKTDVSGRIGIDPEFTFGPYLSNVIPVNPFTETNDIRIVEEWPEQPIGTEAWIYNCRDGDIHPNVTGVTPDGSELFDL